MATSLLRLGRLGYLKCLQFDSRGIVRSHPAIMFCSGAEDTTKSTTKTKAASKIGAQDERATLLAYKTAVAFPLRFSKPEISSAQYLGVAEPESSSSSSDSESDSDSDSDDEKSEVKTQTKTSPPKMTESAMKEDTITHKVTSELKYGTNEDNKEASSNHKYTPVSAVETVQEMTSSPPAPVPSAVKAAQANLETPSDSSEELLDSAPVFCTAADDPLEVTRSVPKTRRETPVEAVAEVASPEKNPCHHSESTDLAHSAQIHVEVAASAPVEVAASAPVEVAASAPVEAAAKPLEVEIAPTEAAAEHLSDDSTHIENTKELMDPAQVIAEGAREDLHVETTVEEQKVAPPDPEDPFDNSTYKNYQHHSYTPFTFVDLDVEMAKFRLPQPSSGRPSPRH